MDSLLVSGFREGREGATEPPSSAPGRQEPPSPRGPHGGGGVVWLGVKEEEEEEFIRIHGYYRGTQGARCYTDGASLQPDESEGCSPVSVVGLIRLCAPLGRLTTLLPTSMLSRHGC